MLTCKKPQLDILDSGMWICLNRSCPYNMEMILTNEASKTETRWKGCPDLLSLFYLREIWLRLIGTQKLSEQTRNITVANAKQTARVINTAKSSTEALGLLVSWMERMTRAIGKPNNHVPSALE